MLTTNSAIETPSRIYRVWLKSENTFSAFSVYMCPEYLRRKEEVLLCEVKLIAKMEQNVDMILAYLRKYRK